VCTEAYLDMQSIGTAKRPFAKLPRTLVVKEGYLLSLSIMLVVVSKGVLAVKFCCNKILSLLSLPGGAG